MDNSDRTGHEQTGAREVTVEDLLKSESSVLRRIGDDIREGQHNITAHMSYSSGHRSSGAHNSHTSSSPVESPLVHSDPAE